MTAAIIRGDEYRDKYLLPQLKEAVARIRAGTGTPPRLDVVLVSDRTDSANYVAGKEKLAKELGMESSIVHRFPSTISEQDLCARVAELCKNPAAHGILVQLPLPAHINKAVVLNAIDPAKDVDGLTEENVKKAEAEKPALKDIMSGAFTGLYPCTPVGSMLLLEEALTQTGKRVENTKAVMVGYSPLVGKPTFGLLQHDGRYAAVDYTRSTTPKEEADRLIREADVVVTAVGTRAKGGFVLTQSMVKPGAVVIDVSINEVIGADGKPVLGEKTGRPKTQGDADFDGVKNIASAITPVPGGVGPMTVAVLMFNTVLACCRQNGLDVNAIMGASHRNGSRSR